MSPNNHSNHSNSSNSSNSPNTLPQIDTQTPAPTPEPSKEVTSSALQTFLLTDDEQRVIRGLNQQSQQARQRFSDNAYEIMQIEEALHNAKEQQNEIVKTLRSCEEKVKERLAECALARNIDVTNPAYGRWNFNFDTMTFTKIS